MIFFSVGCICPAVFAPVCGDDGNDYGNECEANCDGAKVACDGSCPCPRKYEKNGI